MEGVHEGFEGFGKSYEKTRKIRGIHIGERSGYMLK